MVCHAENVKTIDVVRLTDTFVLWGTMPVGNGNGIFMILILKYLEARVDGLVSSL